MAEPHNPNAVPPPHDRRHKDRQPAWFKALAWIAAAAGVIALLFALSRCSGENEAGIALADGHASVVAETPNAAGATALAGTSALGGYLAGQDAAPRGFQFETLKFATAGSAIAAPEAAEVGQIAGVLKRYGTAQVRIAGYADARGGDAANVALGKARADAVKAALVAQGIAADRIETVSGGEADPVGSNATPAGQAENRRTELVVTRR